ncbi:MAG: type I glyceraldehyde-3-phosphate dehydrogenase [Candidatus Parcubacteria bacterium]|nr:type I glyceraldehyde-3-phosphate dehydrogenase [Candidatus Parcubacteria bacterium]
MATKIAINGMGRIGRSFLTLALGRSEFDIIAANDLGDLNNVAYLMKYDTAYGRSPFDIEIKEADGKKFLVVNGKEIQMLSEKDPAKLPWKDLGVELVVEATGFFESYEKAKFHLDAGAKRVVITSPVKGTPPEGIVGASILSGINENTFATCQISSNASCTTNSVSPVIQILHETIGIEKAMLSTIHAYTGTQKLVDSPDAKDWRRGRAAAQNIVPSTTGAAIAVTEVITDLKGKFDGIAFRIPVITGSMSDITFLAKRNTTVEEVNSILKEAVKTERWNKVFAVNEEQLVSSDIIGQRIASIADLTLTKVVDGNLVKVCVWYDNEMGYTSALVDHVVKLASFIK